MWKHFAKPEYLFFLNKPEYLYLKHFFFFFFCLWLLFETFRTSDRFFIFSQKYHNLRFNKYFDKKKNKSLVALSGSLVREFSLEFFSLLIKKKKIFQKVWTLVERRKISSLFVLSGFGVSDRLCFRDCICPSDDRLAFGFGKRWLPKHLLRRLCLRNSVA